MGLLKDLREAVQLSNDLNIPGGGSGGGGFGGVINDAPVFVTNLTVGIDPAVRRGGTKFDNEMGLMLRTGSAG